MPKKNDIVKIKITDIANDGFGVGKTDDGYVVFVPKTAPGDIINARILKPTKSFAYGKIEEMISPSSDRIEPDCPVFSKCGGCVLRHINYKSELNIKRSTVVENFKRIGGFNITDCEIFPSPQSDGYRNKAQYPAGTDSDGKLRFGFFAAHSHRVIPCANCALQPKFYADIVSAVEAFLNRHNIQPYNEIDGSGLVRHLYIRDGRGSGEVMVALIINGASIAYKGELIEKVRSACDKVTSISLIENRRRDNVILGDKCTVIYGKDHITDTLCNLEFDISPMSFYQVNHNGAELLYSIAKKCADVQNGETLLDLYCGTGTIGLTMADTAKKLIGVEIIPSAIENARKNAEKNGIFNAEFICADAGRASKELSERGLRPDVVIVDPPRKGCGSDVFEAISAMSPKRIVMVSCNSSTGARDAKLFSELGYKIKYLCAVDMFPRTEHVETVCLLSKI